MPFNPTIVHIFPCHFQKTPVPILDVVLSSESALAFEPGLDCMFVTSSTGYLLFATLHQSISVRSFASR